MSPLAARKAAPLLEVPWPQKALGKAAADEAGC